MSRTTAFLAAALVAAGGAAATAQEAPRTMLILDGSGSMWGQIDGTAKITIARDAIAGMLDGWPEGREIGLTVYGHTREGDCGDIETVLAPGPLDRTAFDAALADVTPRGKTPLTEATRRAARALSHEDTPATVILVTDGRETCNADPCAAAETLERTGTDFTAHVIGFGIGAEAGDDLSCLAEATGGRYLAAANADELVDALEVAAAPEPEPQPAGPAIVDDFDRAELGPDWEVINPDPSAYVVDQGALIALTTEPTHLGEDNQTNVFRWTGGGLPEGDWDMEVTFTSDFTTRRSIVQLAMYDDAENFVVAALYGDGSSNDDIELEVKSVVGGEETRATARFASDSCCPRDYDIGFVMDELKAKGGTLTLKKRGREYSAEIETAGWVPREGQDNPLTTEPLTVLRASGDPVLFSGTWGRDYGDLPQTVTEFDRLEVTPR